MRIKYKWIAESKNINDKHRKVFLTFIRHTDQWEDAGYSREQLYYGPERMWKMWEKHIEPRIQAGLTHKSVPDKRRWERDNIHDNIDFSDALETEIPKKFQEQLANRDPDEVAFNTPVGRWANKKKY